MNISKEKKGKYKKDRNLCKTRKRNNIARILFPLNLLKKTFEKLNNMYISLSIIFLK